MQMKKCVCHEVGIKINSQSAQQNSPQDKSMYARNFLKTERGKGTAALDEKLHCKVHSTSTSICEKANFIIHEAHEIMV